MRLWLPQFDGMDFILFRVGGPGLGNLLFPFSRALIGAVSNDEKFVFPTFPQIKIGPVLRGERDTRSYADVFRPTETDLGAVFRILSKIGRYRRCEETKIDPKAQLVIVHGLRGYFEGLHGRRKLLQQEISARLHPQIASEFRFQRRNVIAVHVRRGDFREPTGLTDSNCTRTPINWYVAIVQKISSISDNQHFEVYSDGTDEELEPLLQLPRVTRAQDAESIVHIARISRSKSLIASGSTFSMWAAFLGCIPVIYYPGQKTQSVVSDLGLYEGEVYESDLSREDCLPLIAGTTYP